MPLGSNEIISKYLSPDLNDEAEGGSTVASTIAWTLFPSSRMDVMPELPGPPNYGQLSVTIQGDGILPGFERMAPPYRSSVTGTFAGIFIMATATRLPFPSVRFQFIGTSSRAH
jgi:hypothetical protein